VEVLTNAGNSGEVSAQDKALGLIAPQHGERYLQIAAISSHMVPSFLADLKKYNVQASVAPGPHDGLVRIVIGPFSDRDSTARAKDQIQTKWPDCFARLY
jgi:cell division septation protein DedD